MDWTSLFLFNHDFFAFGYATWQAGLNMIPGKGWEEYLKAWAESKMED